jgi:hypothetical protein
VYRRPVGPANAGTANNSDTTPSETAIAVRMFPHEQRFLTNVTVVAVS